MFGHDDKQHQDDQHGPQPDASLTQDSIAMPPSNNMPSPAPALPNDDDSAGDYLMTDSPQPLNDGTATDEGAATTDTSTVVAPTARPVATSGNSAELLSIKQKALSELTPLVDHLDQTPEERFRTTMMMIQASDNDTLIPVAYKAAQEITDEKARAQALLDIVNEINYFTQQHDA